jgi:TolB-like protein/DNA-binding SARP family transcriptional activator
MDTVSALGNGIERPPRWSLRLFGGFELAALPGGDRVVLPGKRERVLLAYLALSPSNRQHRRKLAALLWGDATDETLLDNLRACVWKLRKALRDTEHRVLASDGEDIVLDAQAFEADTWAFQRLATNADRVGLEAATKLYAGEFLDGLDIDSEEFEAWRRTEATRYRDQATDVLTRLMAQLAEAGETERAIEVGVRALQLEPLHEVAARHLMRLYAETSRRGLAIQLYRSLADTLKTELHAQPEAETRAVFAEIARGGEETPAPTAAEAKPPPATSIATPSVGPQSPPPMPGPAQEGPAIGPAQKVVPPQARKRPLGWIVAGGLAAAMALFLLYHLAGPIAQPTGIEAAKTASSSPAGTVAIAVLPFVNLSSDPEQEFFSDGMTEEITTALAKVPNLRVVGRTSAFQFKSANKDLRAIGLALSATHLIEGSVRKDGNQLRISAQLIKVDDGTHVWTESYDRELKGVFAVQEEIAQAIAAALRVPLGLQQGESLVRDRTTDLVSYDQYLRAKALYRARNLPEAIKLLEPVVASDPGFAPAWALLAQVYVVAPNFSPEVSSGSLEEARRFVQSTQDKAEMAARAAIRLDPRNAIAHAVLARVQALHRREWAASDDLNKQAVALDPNEPDVLLNYAVAIAQEGRLKDALSMMEKLRTLEPFVPIFNALTAHYFVLNGQSQTAIPILEAIPADAGGGLLRNQWLAQAYAAVGRYGAAADTVLLITASQMSRRSVEEAARLLRGAPAKVSAPQALPELGRILGFVYAYVGAPERILENYEPGKDRYGLGDAIWLPELSPLRKTVRFKALMRVSGLADYWRERGWPDLCHPTTGDDFVCD